MSKLWADLLLIEPLPTVKKVPFDCLDSSGEPLVWVLALLSFSDLSLSGAVVLAVELALIFAFSIAGEARLAFSKVILSNVLL